MCSIEASISVMVTSSLVPPVASSPSRLRTRACDAHSHPAPAWSTPVITIRFTPSGPANPYSSATSSAGWVRTKDRLSPSSLISAISFGTQTSSPSSSWLIPKATPRFGLGSPSIAVTRCPRRARTRDRVAEIVVFPEPPLPATATFKPLLSFFLYSYTTLLGTGSQHPHRHLSLSLTPCTHRSFSRITRKSGGATPSIVAVTHPQNSPSLRSAQRHVPFSSAVAARSRYSRRLTRKVRRSSNLCSVSSSFCSKSLSRCR